MLNSAFVNRLKEQYPTDAEQMLAAIEKEPNTSVRVSGLNAEGLEEELGVAVKGNVEWCPEAYYLDKRPKFTLAPLFHAGVIYPQESSSMFIYHAVKSVADMLPEEPVVLDLCASPGGKSTLLANWLNGKGYLVANEPERKRAWILRENIAKQGHSNVVVTNLYPADLLDKSHLNADLMLIDAPCSGEGMFRKDDVAVTEWTPERARQCEERQRQIIDDAWGMLKQNGVLIYSTCTFNPGENEDNMDWLLDEFDAEEIDLHLEPDWGVTRLRHGYAFLPHKVQGEGFYCCVIRKRSSNVCKPLGSKLPKILNGAKLPVFGVYKSLESLHDGFKAYRIGDEVCVMPSKYAEDMSLLALRTGALWCGALLGTLIKNELTYASEYALQKRDVAGVTGLLQIYDASRDEALDYLRGNQLNIEPEEHKRFVLLTYKGYGLGLLKIVGNRMNNLYTKEWRIKQC